MTPPVGEFLVLTGFGHGHLFPCMELCNRIACRNRRVTLVLFSHLYSSIHPSFLLNPLVEVVRVASPSPRPGLPRDMQLETYTRLAEALEGLLSGPRRPVCAVVNVFMLLGWTKETFKKFNVPTVALFTSGACSPCMEIASYKARPDTIGPREVRLLPGLPEEMGLSVQNIKRRPSGPPTKGRVDGPNKPRMGPPGPGEKPDWMDDVADTIGLMFNTFDELERPFLRYLGNEFGKPALAVGPLLPERYWKKSEGCHVVHDGELRANHQCNVTEESVLEWLNSNSRGSVIYIAFGSTLNLTVDECNELAEALAESSWPFIWVIQPGPVEHFPDGLASRVGRRGLVISGWAPQLSILSHPSTGGFLSHCGWNSTIEAILQGVPFLACPIRGDQYDNARWLVEHMKLGYALSEDPSLHLSKADFVNGIERLMTDDSMKKRAKELSFKFGDGFPVSSDEALDALMDLVNEQVA